MESWELGAGHVNPGGPCMGLVSRVLRRKLPESSDENHLNSFEGFELTGLVDCQVKKTSPCQGEG